MEPPLDQPPSPVARWTLATVWIAAALLWGRLLLIAAWDIGWPLDLALETPHVLGAALIRAGTSPYGQEGWGPPNFNLLLYSPAYHHLLAWLPRADNPYLAGRVLVMLASIGLLSSLLVLARSAAERGLALALGGWVATFAPLSQNLVHVRPDVPALLLSSLAVLVAVRFPTARGLILAGALAALAVLTKQTMLACCLVTFVVAVRAGRRAFVGFALAFVSLSALGWGAALLRYGVTDLWFSLVTLAAMPHTMATRAAVFVHLWQPTTMVLLGAAVALSFFGRRQVPGALSLWLLAAFARALLASGREGAGGAYLNEAVVASAAVVLAWVVNDARAQRTVVWAATATVLLVGAAWHVLATPIDAQACLSRAERASIERVAPRLTADIAAVRDERPVLNLVASGFKWMPYGYAVLPDCYLYCRRVELGKPGTEDLLQWIREGRFSAVVHPPAGFHVPAQLVDALSARYLEAPSTTGFRIMRAPRVSADHLQDVADREHRDEDEQEQQADGVDP